MRLRDRVAGVALPIFLLSAWLTRPVADAPLADTSGWTVRFPELSWVVAGGILGGALVVGVIMVLVLSHTGKRRNAPGGARNARQDREWQGQAQDRRRGYGRRYDR